MFALLDTITEVEVVSDLILSFLPLRFIDYTNDDISRLYRSVRGVGGLVVPRLVFTQTVWADRLSNWDSPNGIKLYALRVLGESEEAASEEEGRPSPGRPAILNDILISIQQPSHSLCNSAMRKLILSKQGTITDQEYDYLNNHFCSPLLNIFYTYLENGDHFEITQSGIGEFLAQLIHTVGTDDKCAGILEDLIGWVVEKLDGDTDTFKKYILDSHEEKFKELVNIVEARLVDSEVGRKLRVYLSIHPPLQAI